jgi:hypothetical protein
MGRGGVSWSILAASRLLKIPSGGISPFQTATTLQLLCRKGFRTFPERYMEPL